MILQLLFLHQADHGADDDFRAEYAGGAGVLAGGEYGVGVSGEW